MRIHMSDEMLNKMRFIINKKNKYLNIIGFEEESLKKLPKELHENLINLNKNKVIDINLINHSNFDYTSIKSSLNIEVKLTTLEELIII